MRLMTLTAVTLAYRKKKIRIDKTTTKVLYRPDTMLISTYDNNHKNFRRMRVIPLRHNILPPDVAHEITAPDTVIVAWTDEEIMLLQQLLHEAGLKSRRIMIGHYREYLASIGIPTKTLAKTAKALGCGTCPREGVVALSKVKRRFFVRRKTLNYILRINRRKHWDGILI